MKKTNMIKLTRWIEKWKDPWFVPRSAPIMHEIKRVDRAEALEYLLPALRVLSELNMEYEVKEDEIVIKIPRFIPTGNIQP